MSGFSTVSARHQRVRGVNPLGNDGRVGRIPLRKFQVITFCPLKGGSFPPLRCASPSRWPLLSTIAPKWAPLTLLSSTSVLHMVSKSRHCYSFPDKLPRQHVQDVRWGHAHGNFSCPGLYKAQGPHIHVRLSVSVWMCPRLTSGFCEADLVPCGEHKPWGGTDRQTHTHSALCSSCPTKS